MYTEDKIAIISILVSIILFFSTAYFIMKKDESDKE